MVRVRVRALEMQHKGLNSTVAPGQARSIAILVLVAESSARIQSHVGEAQAAVLVVARDAFDTSNRSRHRNRTHR